MSVSSAPKASPERCSELSQSLSEINQRVQAAARSRQSAPTLVAVSKYKPASDIAACYDAGHRDFGENYVQELVEKAEQLPQDIRWHFIGTLQSNKAKILASIPNLYSLHTLTSEKAATGLNKALPEDRPALNVLIQVNTSGEDSKSGLPPLSASTDASSSELLALALHVLNACPRLHLHGLMTIGSISESLTHDKPNRDFETLKETRAALHAAVSAAKGAGKVQRTWGRGDEGDQETLLLSMGMSSDFEGALGAGSDVVRVGTGIFGARPKQEHAKAEVHNNNG